MTSKRGRWYDAPPTDNASPVIKIFNFSLVPLGRSMLDYHPSSGVLVDGEGPELPTLLLHWNAETEFVQAAMKILNHLQISELHANPFLIGKLSSAAALIAPSPTDAISLALVDPIIRANLRSEMFSRLFFEDRLFITFGHDMNMYIGLTNPVPESVLATDGGLVRRDVSDRIIDTHVYYFGATRPESD